ncbi:MAG TPA: GDP-mannose 4,6-dehydratase [Candidatus Nanoarchaeia archaeon]|nr:GDP-mannose 4,6-dehydratase [Candidatus Nanoarchaeia archaeon]
MKKALITGITGQDGSYLAEFLIEKGYEVHGIVRRSSGVNRDRIDHLTEIDKSSGYTGVDKGSLILHYGDLTDSSSVEKIIRSVMPDEVYNLGAQSHVRISFDIPENTTNTVSLGTLRLLESIKNICPNSRFYQASSSEMFGKVVETPQKETTPFYPRSPYACAKVYAHHITINYREAYGIFACNGILFNHESERRGESFVTRKITRSLARIKMGLQKEIYLGNLDSERDWGHAKDYVRAMWMILQQDKAEDYIIGTGEKYSVRHFLEESAKELGLNIKSNGKSGFDEEYLDENGKVIVKIHPRYFRPTEVDLLLSDPTKAKEKLGWVPEISFKELVKKMCEHDLKLAEKEYYLKHKAVVVDDIIKILKDQNNKFV